MKSLILAFTLLTTTHAFADSFACTLRVGTNYKTEHESQYRSRTVKVSIGDFTCDGTFKSGVMRALLYQPHLWMDQDIYEGLGDHTGVEVRSDADDASCSCSLM